MRFKHEYAMQIHSRRCRGEDPFDCAECGKTFAEKSEFRKHIKIHKGEKGFSVKYHTYTLDALLKYCKVNLCFYVIERPFIARVFKIFLFFHLVVKHLLQVEGRSNVKFVKKDFLVVSN